MLDISNGVSGGVLSKDTESNPPVALTSILSVDANILMRSNSSSRDSSRLSLILSGGFVVSFFFDFLLFRFVGFSCSKSL